MIGVIPSGGTGKRMRPFYGLKELFPVGYEEVQIGSSTKLIPMVASQYTIREMYKAGVRKACFVISVPKYEILKFYASGSRFGMNLSYMCQDEPTGMPGAIDTAYPWSQNQTVMMGMPDTILEPTDCFVQLLAFHKEKKSDLSLGVFPTQMPQFLAPVHIDQETERVLEIFDKPKNPLHFNTWGIAIWSPDFTELLHCYVQQRIDEQRTKELIMTNVFLEAKHQGLKVYAKYFDHGRFYDVGTPDGLVRARYELEYQHLGYDHTLETE